MTLTHLSLFSGIGGLDLAAGWAGIETIGQCEWADYPTKVLEKHWPDVPKWRDIHDLTAVDFERRTGRTTIDIVSGGFPCQPFSIAGNRKGKEDDRYLWPQMLRVIQELKPTWVIGENVAGLVSMVEPDAIIRVESRTINRQKDFDSYESILSRQKNMLLFDIIRDIERIGYEVQPFIIPACAVGAPHRRERIFIVGYSQYNGQLAKQKLRSYEEAGNKRREKKPSASRQFEGADRSVDVSSLSRGENGSQQNVANSYNTGLQRRFREILPECACEWAAGEGSTYVANTVNEGLEGRKCQDNTSKHWQDERVFAGSGDASGWGNWWKSEPDVGRVANGIPARVDRLKCLGNAVVPQQAYPIFRAIAELEAEHD